ncbi:MAG TPA: pentapeptide repeat-containing protein [Armatimonadota bacterium]|nr:pentapeptide repeat-containing protein [Armatimonadota bacterium]
MAARHGFALLVCVMLLPTVADAAPGKRSPAAGPPSRRAAPPLRFGPGALLDRPSAEVVGKDHVNANLANRKLAGARLRFANLRGAILRGADLSGADLRGAQLKSADLSRANLRRARLRGATLFGADLTGADLGGADLRQALYDGATRWPVGFNPAVCGCIRCDGPGGTRQRVYARTASGRAGDTMRLVTRRPGSLMASPPCA